MNNNNIVDKKFTPSAESAPKRVERQQPPSTFVNPNYRSLPPVETDAKLIEEQTYVDFDELERLMELEAEMMIANKKNAPKPTPKQMPVTSAPVKRFNTSNEVERPTNYGYEEKTTDIDGITIKIEKRFNT